VPAKVDPIVVVLANAVAEKLVDSRHNLEPDDSRKSRMARPADNSSTSRWFREKNSGLVLVSSAVNCVVGQAQRRSTWIPWCKKLQQFPMNCRLGVFVAVDPDGFVG
jgi:hypothetical protein